MHIAFILSHFLSMDRTRNVEHSYIFDIGYNFTDFDEIKKVLLIHIVSLIYIIYFLTSVSGMYFSEGSVLGLL